MHLSPYTFLFSKENRHYAFSSLTKSLLELDFETYSKLLQLSQSENRNTINPKFEESNSDVLYNTHIVCDRVADEYDLCKSMILNRRNDRSDMHITIAPTMDCCFSCYYCFERHKKPAYMTRETADSIIEYVNAQTNLKNLHVTWFGGEPLMAIDIIRYFTDALLKVFKGSYSADIITTAFHVNEEVVKIIKNAHITEMQVSIDGKEKTHNSVKHTFGCENSYIRILDNIELLNEHYPALTIGLRVNLTKQNCNEYEELFCELSDRFRGKRVSIIPGFIVNRNNVVSPDIFSYNEVSQFSINLWESYKIPTPWIMYDKGQGECAIRKINSLVVDASANIYKCWEKLGDEKYTIGKLTRGGVVTETNHELLQRFLFGADPLNDEKCKVCKMLPICFGGCPIQRIENVFENKKNILCTTHKEKVVQWLSAYLDLKELVSSQE